MQFHIHFVEKGFTMENGKFCCIKFLLSFPASLLNLVNMSGRQTCGNNKTRTTQIVILMLLTCANGVNNPNYIQIHQKYIQITPKFIKITSKLHQNSSKLHPNSSKLQSNYIQKQSINWRSGRPQGMATRLVRRATG